MFARALPVDDRLLTLADHVPRASVGEVFPGVKASTP
jgi:hypothetical protein